MASANNQNKESLPLLHKPLSPFAHHSFPVLPTENFVAVLLAFSASLGFCSLQLFARLGTTRLHLSVALFVIARGVTAIVSTSAFLRTTGSARPGAPIDLLFIVLCGFLGAWGLYFKIEAVSRIPLSVASAVFATAPAFAILISLFILKQTFLPSEISSCFIALAAVVFIAMSPEGNGSPVEIRQVSGIAFGIAGACCQATYFNVVRWIGKKFHSQWYVLSLGCWSFVLGCVLLYTGCDVRAQMDIIMSHFASATLLLVGAGLSGYVGASFVNSSAQMISPGTVAVIRSTDIPLSYLLGFLFLQERPTSWHVVAGSAVIAVCAITLGWKRASRG